MKPPRRLRRTITLAVSRRRRGGVVEKAVRLFTMNENQRRAFDDATSEIVLGGGCSRPEAELGVEKVVGQLLAGAMPGPQDPTSFHRLRLAFPILKPKQIEALPRAGCPDGWIEAVVISLVTARPVRRVRSALLRFDDAQARMFNDALPLVMEWNSLSRDDAWLFLINTVGALVSGKALDGGGNELIEDLKATFPALSEAEAAALPEATEEDVARWAFTTGAGA